LDRTSKKGAQIKITKPKNDILKGSSQLKRNPLYLVSTKEQKKPEIRPIRNQPMMNIPNIHTSTLKVKIFYQRNNQKSNSIWVILEREAFIGQMTHKVKWVTMLSHFDQVRTDRPIKLLKRQPVIIRAFMPLGAENRKDFNRPFRINDCIFDANFFDNIGINHCGRDIVDRIIVNVRDNVYKRFFSSSRHGDDLKMNKTIIAELKS
jgi:hypothetical protein